MFKSYILLTIMFLNIKCAKPQYLSKIFNLKFRALYGNNSNKFSENVLSSPAGDISFPKISTTEWIYSKMEPFSKYTAVECVETGKKYTYEQVRTKSNNLNKALRKYWDLENGDVVAIFLPNCPDFFVACMGILEAGLVITTINNQFKSDEIAKQLLDSLAKIIITHPDTFKEAQEACSQIKTSLPIICIKTRETASLPEKAVHFEELINSKIDLPDPNPIRPDNIAFLPYSSGTTGKPKGVEISHSNLVAMSCQTLHPDYVFTQSPTDNYQDISAGIIPMSHIYGFTLLQLLSLTTGVKILSFPKFSPDLFIRATQNHKISLLHGVPPLILFMTNHPGVQPEKLENLKFILCGAAPLGILDEKRFKQKMGRRIFMAQGYGMSETTGMIASMASKKYVDAIEKYQGTSGPPVAGTFFKIINVDEPSGKHLGPNKSGELLVKGPQVMKRYLNRPKETQEVFLDGWLRTGDIGHCNEEGMIFVTDRLKELIKVKGFQVAPAELEELIRDIPSVQDAAVIGIPHPQFGEVPRAYIVKKNDTKLTSEDVQKFVAEKSAKHKHLMGGVEIVDSIPKTASGKILRKELKQDYQKQLNK